MCDGLCGLSPVTLAAWFLHRRCIANAVRRLRGREVLSFEQRPRFVPWDDLPFLAHLVARSLPRPSVLSEHMKTDALDARIGVSRAIVAVNYRSDP